MTVANFLAEHAQRGSEMMLEVTNQCSKICIGWITKALKRSGKVDKYATNEELQNHVRSIYEDAILILFENVPKGKVKRTDALLSTYLTGICKNLLRNEQAPFLDLPPIYEPIDDGVVAEERSPEQIAKLRACRDTLDKKQKLLLDYHLEKILHEEIARRLGYKNRDVVKSTLYKILMQLGVCLEGKDFFN